MASRHTHLHTPRRRRAGTAMITVLGALLTLLALGALAIDAGAIWTARTQLQNASDAAALSAAGTMIDPDVPQVRLDAARTSAMDVASRNMAISSSSLALPPEDVDFGSWDLETESFDPDVDLGDPSLVTAARVQTRLDGVANGPVPAFLSRVLGRQSFAVGASAVAYLGFAGTVAPGEVDLPVAIDCCKLRGPDCADDYCATIQSSPPNPCTLARPQEDGVTTVSCLEFHATEEQNACWTAFDGVDSSVNSSQLTDIVRSGNPAEIGPEPIYLDNGDKASVIFELANRFYGDGYYGGSPSGTDRYAPFDGPDSWVVSLPVVECQSEDGCAGGYPSQVVGFVCFEIREIEGAPDKLIRGRFLCPSDPLFDECDIGRTTSGGMDFGIRADVPVLVQ